MHPEEMDSTGSSGGERRLAAAALLSTAAAALVFGLVAGVVRAGETRWLDQAIFHYLRASATPRGDTLMHAVSWFGNGWALLLIATVSLAAALFLPGVPRARAISLLAAVGGGELLIGGLKLLFHRARPEASFANLGFSFPSGHAFFSVAVYGMLAGWVAGAAPRRWRPLIWLGAASLILLIGFSRIYLGEHYATDVLGGYAAGVPWLQGCLSLPGAVRRLVNAWFPKRV